MNHNQNNQVSKLKLLFAFSCTYVTIILIVVAASIIYFTYAHYGQIKSYLLFSDAKIKK